MNVQEKSFIFATAVGLCAFGPAPSSAMAQAAVPTNALDHTFRSLDELRDAARAAAGYRKARWICQQPSGPCVWKPGYWGPPPPKPAPGAYIYVRPFDGVERNGYYTLLLDDEARAILWRSAVAISASFGPGR
jgi:hypothetical protein